MSTDHMLYTALDGRAAAFEKMDKLQQALRDAKSMIELKPELSKGYLRCGKILQLKREHALALKIYDRGLNKVKIGADQDRTMLQAMYNKLRKELNPGKSFDPLEHLPLELAQMICHNLGMRDLVICLAVSRGWKKLLESTHSLWTTFDTTHTRKAISDKSFKIHLKRSNYTLERAIITLKAQLELKKMLFMTRSCKNLCEIEVRGSGVIGASLYESLTEATKLHTLYVSRDTGMYLAGAQLTLKARDTSLENVTMLNLDASTSGYVAGRWPRLEALRSLYLCAKGDSCLDLHGLRDATPNVVRVILNDWRIMPLTSDLTTWPRLEHLDLTNTQLGHVPRLPSTVKQLILSKNPHLHMPVTDQGIEEIYKLPLLDTFACNSTFIDALALKGLTKQSIESGNLKTLLIGARLNDYGNIPAKEEFPASDTVEYLSLADLQLTDDKVIEITKLYPSLRMLDLANTQITGVTVKDVILRGVTCLKINGCDYVSIDAVEWARSKGVEVEFAFKKAGRRSRFADSTFARGLG